jgi:carbon storage regulator
MLILTRKSEESVMVGNNIEIRILEVRGDQVRIGFTAPRDIAIYRKEVHEAIQAENAQAAGRGPQGLQQLGQSLGQELVGAFRSIKERRGG